MRIIADLKIEVSEIIRSKRRTFAIEVHSDARVVVRVPLRASDDLIEKIIHKRRSWIHQKQELARERCRLIPKREFADGEGLMYLGGMYRLKVVEEQAAPLLFNGGFLLSKDHVDRARDLFIGWYRKEAFRKISDRVLYHASVSGIKCGRVNITGAGKRWGSCSPNGNLNFSWRLIMAPLGVVDYVVLHELAHISEKSHSKRFWLKVDELCPDYRLHEKWLNENGHMMVI